MLWTCLESSVSEETSQSGSPRLAPGIPEVLLKNKTKQHFLGAGNDRILYRLFSFLVNLAQAFYYNPVQLGLLFAGGKMVTKRPGNPTR